MKKTENKTIPVQKNVLTQLKPQNNHLAQTHRRPDLQNAIDFLVKSLTLIDQR